MYLIDTFLFWIDFTEFLQFVCTESESRVDPWTSFRSDPLIQTVCLISRFKLFEWIFYFSILFSIYFLAFNCLYLSDFWTRNRPKCKTGGSSFGQFFWVEFVFLMRWMSWIETFSDIILSFVDTHSSDKVWTLYSFQVCEFFTKCRF